MLVIALGLGLIAGPASAQDLSDYGDTTPSTSTVPPQPATPEPPAPEEEPAPDDDEGETTVKAKRAGGGAVTPSVSSDTSTPTATIATPTRLAYTGAEPLLVGGAGLALLLAAGGLALRRRSA